MEKQIKGLRKLSTAEMENVKGGIIYIPPDVVRGMICAAMYIYANSDSPTYRAMARDWFNSGNDWLCGHSW